MLENLVTIIKIIEIKYELTQLVIYQIRVDPRHTGSYPVKISAIKDLETLS